MPTFSIAQIALLVIVTVAGIIDWKTKKIFNVITFPAAALGIVLNFMSGGWQAALVAVAGWIVAVAIMIVPDHILMKKPKMYFGDAKLMAAIGAFVGPGGVLLTFLFFSIIYGLVAVTKTASVFPWQKMSMAMKTGVVTDDFLQDEKLQSALKSKIPLGPSIAVGTFLAIVLQKPTLDLLGFHDTTMFGLPMILSFAGYWF
jgi:prepilin peptidase CpaA